MLVRIATPQELQERGYLATVMASGEVAYVRTLANGKQVGVRQATIDELSGVTWDWSEFEEQRDYHGIPSRRFLNTAPGRWVMEEMAVAVVTQPEVKPTRHLCHCTTRELMMHGCKCGGV